MPEHLPVSQDQAPAYDQSPAADMDVRRAALMAEAQQEFDQYWKGSAEQDAGADQFWVRGAGAVALSGADVVAEKGQASQTTAHEAADRERPKTYERGLPTGEYIQHAPSFAEQANDTTRTNTISYVSGVSSELGLGTNYATDKAANMTEYQSLHGLRDFLQQAADRPVPQGASDRNNKRAASMLENLTFIGQREYDEAARGIADKWRTQLQQDPELQICAVAGEIDTGDMVKSDAYLLDNILKNFSDEELAGFGGRLVAGPEHITAKPEDVAVVLVDDWTISGAQLKKAGQEVASRYPQYKDRLQVQLLAATQDRLRDGITVDAPWTREVLTEMPVSAYFMANQAAAGADTLSGAHITGAHCAVDYDFNNDIARMLPEGADMPPATNIVRPYRQEDVQLDQYKRLETSMAA